MALRGSLLLRYAWEPIWDPAVHLAVLEVPPRRGTSLQRDGFAVPDPRLAVHPLGGVLQQLYCQMPLAGYCKAVHHGDDRNRMGNDRMPHLATHPGLSSACTSPKIYHRVLRLHHPPLYTIDHVTGGLYRFLVLRDLEPASFADRVCQKAYRPVSQVPCQLPGEPPEGSARPRSVSVLVPQRYCSGLPVRLPIIVQLVPLGQQPLYAAPFPGTLAGKGCRQQPRGPHVREHGFGFAPGPRGNRRLLRNGV
jgi:hypothetical protein